MFTDPKSPGFVPSLTRRRPSRGFSRDLFLARGVGFFPALGSFSALGSFPALGSFFLALGLLPALGSSLALGGVAGTASAGEWVLEKQADGIDVYTRPVVGSDIKEFKGEGVVGIEIEAIVALLRDSSRFKDWFPNTSESKLLGRDGATSYQYSVMSTPWPIADRDNVFLTVLTRDEPSGRIEISVDAAPDAHPIQRGRHRVTRASGSWRLTPQGPDETHVAFTMHLEPGGGIPDWLVNARIVATPFEALENLRNILSGDESH
jgi:hypothetical protein